MYWSKGVLNCGMQAHGRASAGEVREEILKNKLFHFEDGNFGRGF